jgi:uncharacterized RDD family membrane protein YckC
MLCANCGKEHETELDICPVCGAPLRQESCSKVADGMHMPSTPAPGTAPLEPPSDHSLQGERLIEGHRVAGLGDRLIALILDSIMMLAVFAVIGTWVASYWGGWVTGGFSMQGMPAFITIGLSIFFGFLYFWFTEGILGGTLGKGIIGLRIRNVKGGRCTLSQSLVRNLLRIIDGLGVYLVGFFIALFSKFRQRLGDHLAKTVVIEEAGGTAVRIVLVVIWLAVIACAAWGAYAIHSRVPL